jgi:hypothetical protein
MLSYVWYLHIPAAGFKGGIGRFGGARDERLSLGWGSGRNSGSIKQKKSEVGSNHFGPSRDQFFGSGLISPDLAVSSAFAGGEWASVCRGRIFMAFSRSLSAHRYRRSSTFGRRLGAVVAFAIGGVIACASGILLFDPEAPSALALATQNVPPVAPVVVAAAPPVEKTQPVEKTLPVEKVAVPAVPEPLVTPTVVKVERIKPAVVNAAVETPAATESRPRQTAARAVEPTPADPSPGPRTAPVALQQSATEQTAEAPAVAPAPVVAPPPAKPRKTARAQSNRHYESSYRSRDHYRRQQSFFPFFFR